MRKIFLLFAILIHLNLYGQKPDEKIFTDVYSFPLSDSTLQIFYLYNIPVTSFIFSKTDDAYSSTVQISIEISDTNSNIIHREFKDLNVKFDNFSNTINPKAFIEGLLSIQFENKTFTLISRMIDNNSQRERFYKEYKIEKMLGEDLDFLAPIVLRDKTIKCESNDTRILPNFAGFIPFDNNQYDILIPCKDTTLEKLFVKVINNRDTIFSDAIRFKSQDRFSFKECNGNVVIFPESFSTICNYFYLNGLSHKLKEGSVEIIISKTEDFGIKKSFKLVVKWLDKPKFLTDPDSAIRALRFIISSDSIRQLFNSSDNLGKTLYQFWKKKDPSPSTEYNELMTEYYERIDYAISSFSTITGLNGLDTDRAKIYIIYGKPNSVERSSNSDGKVTETWIYLKLQKQFIFVDYKGTGEFILTNSL